MHFCQHSVLTHCRVRLWLQPIAAKGLCSWELHKVAASMYMSYCSCACSHSAAASSVTSHIADTKPLKLPGVGSNTVTVCSCPDAQCPMTYMHHILNCCSMWCCCLRSCTCIYQHSISVPTLMVSLAETAQRGTDLEQTFTTIHDLTKWHTGQQ